jgi:predicted XRE-type DNA-binding protein
MSKAEEAIIEGSGNVFADLRLQYPEERRLKARLASKILREIGARGWTQVQAAAELGLSQPDVSRISNGIVKDFSVERLMQLLQKLGFRVSIQIEGGGQPSEEIRLPLR